MSDFQLKAMLASLSAILFSLFFILLALALPINEKSDTRVKRTAQTKFQKMSESMHKGFKKHK